LLQIKPGHGLLGVYDDVVLANLVEWIFQMVLNVVQADQDQAEQDRHEVLQARREAHGDLGKK
jgi:hypothetical protein